MKNPILITLAIAAVVMTWWLWPTKVELTKSEYDLVLALYRVCNQADSEGLAKVEQVLLDMQNLQTGGTESPLLPILADAKSGKWGDATEACRDLMDDQIRPAG